MLKFEPNRTTFYNMHLGETSLFTKISFFRWYTLVRCKRPGTGLFIESFVNLNMKTIIFRTADYLVRYGAPAEFEKCYELLSWPVLNCAYPAPRIRTYSALANRFWGESKTWFFEGKIILVMGWPDNRMHLYTNEVKDQNL